MEEEVEDFNQWLSRMPAIKIEYFAAFDENTGRVAGIYPDNALPKKYSAIPISLSLAEDILTGKKNIRNFYIDVIKSELVEVKPLMIQDAILHRVIDREFSKDTEYDLLITHTVANNTIKFSLSDSYFRNKIKWAGPTSALIFYFTAYNDPHLLYQTVTVNLEKVENNEAEFEIKVPERYSVFTKRSLSKYLLEIK